MNLISQCYRSYHAPDKSLEIKIMLTKTETGNSLPTPSACLSVDELEIGMSAEKEFSIDYTDVVTFSQISGDWNPAHHDEDYAAHSIFGQRVAHGMFSVAQFSGLLGMDLPGLGTLWLKQSVEFLKPAFLGHSYRAVVTVTDIEASTNTVTLSTECFDEQGDKIITGEGVVKPIPVKIKAKMAD
jgi:3-hydroxybutyryl-CoA dehydratase